MPETARFVDEMRAIFGKDHIDQQIRLGLRGQPVFWARENGIEIGCKPQGRRARPRGDETAVEVERMGWSVGPE